MTPGAAARDVLAVAVAATLMLVGCTVVHPLPHQPAPTRTSPAITAPPPAVPHLVHTDPLSTPTMPATSMGQRLVPHRSARRHMPAAASGRRMRRRYARFYARSRHVMPRRRHRHVARRRVAAPYVNQRALCGVGMAYGQLPAGFVPACERAMSGR